MVGGLFCLFADSYPKKVAFYTQTAQEITQTAQDICVVFRIFAAEKIFRYYDRYNRYDIRCGRHGGERYHVGGEQ